MTPLELAALSLSSSVEGDELINAMLVSEENDVLLVSRKGMSIRFSRR